MALPPIRSDPMPFSALRLSPVSAAGVALALARGWRRLRAEASFRLAPLRRRWERALRAWNARLVVRELVAWPDERLKDIGLSRAAIVSAVEGVQRPFQWVPDHDASQLEPSRFGH